jgi:MFS family permease
MENKQAKGFPPNLILLSIVSFLNDLSSEMVMPILPMFIQALGGSGQVIGLVGGLRDSISSILKIVCGYWSDKLGRRKVFVLAGYLTSTVFKLLLAFSKMWPSAVLFAGFERVGKGLRTAARDAIIADSMNTQRGKGFGLHRAADTAGAISGAVAALLLFWFLGLDFKAIIVTAALFGFASLAPLHFVQEKRRTSRKLTLRVGLARLPRSLKLFMFIAGVFALGNFSYMFFIIRAQGLFSGRVSVAAPILLYVLFNIFYSALAVPLGVVSDRIGREKLIIFGYLLFSLTSFGFAFFDSVWAFVVLFALYGIMLAAIDGTQRAYVSDLARDDLKATALGTFHTVSGLAAMPASLIAGFLWERVSPAATFAYGGTLSLVAVAAFLVFKRQLESSTVRSGL